VDTANISPTAATKIPESKTRPEDGLPAAAKKEDFKDPDVPVEPAVGNDGLEVGGEG